ncbi:MAG: hypothetical protein IT244_05480, partial [Bacteroidia bacterium]|nr:hypothetical protein [Bacteroidia bacterium]
MAKRTTRFLLIFLGLLLLPSGLYSQISKIAKKSYPKFVELLPQTDTSYTMCDSVINIGTAIFDAEQAESDSKMDTLFLAKFCKQMADVYVKNLDYSNATLYFLLSANYYQKIRDDLNAGNSISNYLLYYEVVRLNRMKNNNWRYIDSTIFDHGNADTTIWFTAKARSLTWSDKRDTLFVTINAGKAQNIVEGSKFDVFTTFDTFYAINRSVIQAGTGFITHIDNFTADGFIVINEGFNDTIFDNDAYEVKINVDKRFVGSQTAELGAFNIKFTDHLSNVYFVGGDGNLTINNSKFEKPLKVVMLQSMHDAIAYYDTSNPGVMETLIETGPFAGSTYRQCFKASRLYDLELFLDYIIAYPSKNINREFNLVSKYATWVINDCWLGNKESMVIDSLFLTPENELLARSQYWGGLYNQVTKTDSVLLKQIKDAYELNPQKRIAELNKLHKLAIATKNEKSDSFYSVNLLYEYYGVKDYNKALEYADRVWPKLKGWDKQLIALYKGVQFSNLHRSEEAIRFLDSSLAIDSGYYYAKGYKGWNLLKMGRIKQAIPYCQYSWNYDSFVP